MAEGARLESVFTGNSNVGSNPTLSAKLRFRHISFLLTQLCAPSTVTISSCKLTIVFFPIFASSKYVYTLYHCLGAGSVSRRGARMVRAMGLILIPFVISLSGCATDSTWRKTGARPNDDVIDSYICRYYAEGVSGKSAASDFERRCMIARGWQETRAR